MARGNGSINYVPRPAPTVPCRPCLWLHSLDSIRRLARFEQCPRRRMGTAHSPVLTPPAQPPTKCSRAPFSHLPSLPLLALRVCIKYGAALNHFPAGQLLRLRLPPNKIHSGSAVKAFRKTWLEVPARLPPPSPFPTLELHPSGRSRHHALQARDLVPWLKQPAAWHPLVLLSPPPFNWPHAIKDLTLKTCVQFVSFWNHPLRLPRSCTKREPRPAMCSLHVIPPSATVLSRRRQTLAQGLNLLCQPVLMWPVSKGWFLYC